MLTRLNASRLSVGRPSRFDPRGALILSAGPFALGGVKVAWLLDFVNDPAGAQARMTHDRAGNAMMRNSAGEWVWAPHNLLVQSASPSTQTITVVSGVIYTVECTGSGSVSLSGAGTGTVSTGNPVTITAASTSLALTVSGAVDTFWSYRSDMGGMANNPATGNSYVSTTDAPVYLPRIGHHEWNGSEWVNKGLLKEGQATNFDSSSNEFTDSGAIVITYNADTSPAGDETAVLVSEAAASISSACFLGPTSTGVVGSPICNTLRIKYVSGSGWLALVHRSSSGSNQFFAWFNVLTGTKGSAEAGSGSMTYVDHGIFYEGNGWYVVYTVGSDSVSGDFNGFITSASADLDKGREAGSAYLIWQHQLTEGTQPSSPIPTNGSAVTRLADVMTQPAGTLPWPEPEVIGPELVTNGTFDTDSDWVKTSDWTIADGIASSAGAGAIGSQVLSQDLGLEAGKVYLLDIEVLTGTSNRFSNRHFISIGDGESYTLGRSFESVGITSIGTFSVPVVAGSEDGFIRFFSGGYEDLIIDNISVREIKPLALTIGMSGEVSWSASDPKLLRWYGGYYNQIQFELNDLWGRLEFTQGADGKLSQYNSSNNTIPEGLNVPFSFAGTSASTFLTAAVNGVALTTNTTPTALPDLSATEVDLLPTFNGTVAEIRYYSADVGDAGRLEGSQPYEYVATNVDAPEQEEMQSQTSDTSVAYGDEAVTYNSEEITYGA